MDRRRARTALGKFEQLIRDATDYSYRVYDVFRLEDGAWVWCGYGNGRAILPKNVRKRLAEGRPAECVVEGYRYCIKPPSRGQNRSETSA